jgi:hypothetical protein
VSIDEYEIGRARIDRLNKGSLTEADIEAISSMPPIRPQRHHDYISDQHHKSYENGTLWKEFRPIIPFGIIDGRIADLAIAFWENPDDKLLVGYRRLEDLVRARIASTTHGGKLFSEAFLSKPPKLSWKNIGEGEQVARANLFIGAFGAHRNPRAHRELEGAPSAQVSEFLLLNHLYCLEREATPT